MSAIKIEPFENPGGGQVWRVSGTIAGKRRRQNLRTELEALTLKQSWEREAANLAPLPVVTTRLTDAQAREAEKAFARLEGRPLSMTAAIEFAIANYSPTLKACTVKTAYDNFLLAKQTQNVRAATLSKLKQRVKRLVSVHGAKQVNELQPDDLRAVIFRAGSGLVNQDTDYRAMSCFLNWCVKQEYTPASPLAKVDNVQLERCEPEILTLSQVRALLNAAEAHGQGEKRGALVPYIVLAMFCAIRPTELRRLTWDNVDIETQEITLSGKVAKMRGRRLVKIADNALAYLLPHVTKKRPFVGKNWRKDFAAIRTAAGLTEWPQDIMRHTGISYHLAKHKHEGESAMWAGNSPVMIQKHYKGLVKEKDAAEFWNILPGPSVAVELPQRKAA